MDIRAWGRTIGGLLILTGIHLGATWLMTRLHIPFPGSLFGLLLCAVMLKVGLLRLAWVEEASSLLLRHLPLLYLPLIVALGSFWPLLKQSGVALVPTVMVATGLVAMASGLTV